MDWTTERNIQKFCRNFDFFQILHTIIGYKLKLRRRIGGAELAGAESAAPNWLGAEAAAPPIKNNNKQAIQPAARFFPSIPFLRLRVYVRPTNRPPFPSPVLPIPFQTTQLFYTYIVICVPNKCLCCLPPSYIIIIIIWIQF